VGLKRNKECPWERRRLAGFAFRINTVAIPNPGRRDAGAPRNMPETKSEGLLLIEISFRMHGVLLQFSLSGFDQTECNKKCDRCTDCADQKNRS
jgi:hypothetical protein